MEREELEKKIQRFDEQLDGIKALLRGKHAHEALLELLTANYFLTDIIDTADRLRFEGKLTKFERSDIVDKQHIKFGEILDRFTEIMEKGFKVEGSHLK